MPRPKRYISPEEWKHALIFLAYGVTKNPELAPSMEYAKRKYEASLREDPVAEARRILEDYTREGGRKAIRSRNLALKVNE
jgi:hypothetical protein